MYFGCKIEFKNQGTAKLLTKFESQITKVLPLDIIRCDFDFLNYQIGNSVHNETVAVVGAGSLGSYVVDELVHAGYRNITIIDGDSCEYANIFRHRNHFFGYALPKSVNAAIELKMIHPELNVRIVDQYLTKNNFTKCIPPDTHTIVFTVGSSDIQLQINSLLFKETPKTNVLYAWLEHDGKSSHVAAIRTTSEGCFECLFTDKDGNLCSNTVNQADPCVPV